uniref:Uncharacterized protein n=1 Tax=Glossina brevipalpis TaxID=37001 RepID=A0A1A9WBJ2_9MUSC
METYASIFCGTVVCATIRAQHSSNRTDCDNMSTVSVHHVWQKCFNSPIMRNYINVVSVLYNAISITGTIGETMFCQQIDCRLNSWKKNKNLLIIRFPVNFDSQLDSRSSAAISSSCPTGQEPTTPNKECARANQLVITIVSEPPFKRQKQDNSSSLWTYI